MLHLGHPVSKELRRAVTCQHRSQGGLTGNRATRAPGVGWSRQPHRQLSCHLLRRYDLEEPNRGADQRHTGVRNLSAPRRGPGEASGVSTDLVSIGLPVRNASAQVEKVIQSVLSQDYEWLELVISDNASTDSTEEVCRDLAGSDHRIVYVRQPENIGLLNNFVATMTIARGTYFRWIGDDDRLEPGYATRCVGAFADDPRLILVTSQVAYTGPTGDVQTAAYDGHGLGSSDPVERLSRDAPLAERELLDDRSAVRHGQADRGRTHFTPQHAARGRSLRYQAGPRRAVGSHPRGSGPPALETRTDHAGRTPARRTDVAVALLPHVGVPGDDALASAVGSRSAAAPSGAVSRAPVVPASAATNRGAPVAQARSGRDAHGVEARAGPTPHRPMAARPT